MKKFISLLLCLSVLIAGITGCNNKLNPNNPVTLTMWHNYGGEMQQMMDLLIDEFNATIGKEKGININVTAISSSSDLNQSLSMIVNGDPGAPDMPDIFTGYPKIAVQFQEKGLLANFDDLYTKDELSEYIDAFIEEGRLSDGGLYVFPIAKSTEVLFVNQTLFDEFAESTGADPALLSTMEGIAQLSQMYYDWADGKQFFTSDSWFNMAEVGMVQLGATLLDDDCELTLDNDSYRHIFETIYAPATEGGIAIYDGYSSDLSKTGDIVCSTGSSAGILFYGNTITYADGTIREVEYNILPYPVFENGEKWALQRGGGLIVAKSDARKEEAAAEFIHWLTAPEQNMKFISQTGYLPVTKQAFETELLTHLESVEDVRIYKMLTSVLSMYEEYTFFSAPNHSNLDANSSAYESEFKAVMNKGLEAYQKGSAITADAAFAELTEQ